MICDDQIFTKVIPDTKRTTIKPIIYNIVKFGTKVVSDEWKGYWGLNRNYNHIVLNHMKKQYKNGDYSTYNVENFWSHLKRGIHGVYHKVSPDHLHRYTAEFTFRFNTRDFNEKERLEYVLKNSEQLRLKYNDLINNF